MSVAHSLNTRLADIREKLDGEPTLPFGSASSLFEVENQDLARPDRTALPPNDGAGAEEALRQAVFESEARMRLAIEAADIGIWEADHDLKQLNWDARTRELFGVPDGEALDYEDSFVNRVHPADREPLQARIAEILDAPDGARYEAQFRTIGRAGGRERWLHSLGRMVQSRGTRRVMGTVRDITDQKAAEEHQALLAGELQHRIRNTLTMVQAIVNQSLRDAETPQEATRTISERLITLGKAHDLLTRGNWKTAPVAEIVGGAIAVHRAGTSRIHSSGPAVLLGARGALSLTLVLHELCTNALKHGSLSNETGQVGITWHVEQAAEGQVFRLAWQESGGPSVLLPTRKGFGSRLIENSLRTETDAVTALEFNPSGVRWTLQLPLPGSAQPS